jgi:hypothetical protein
MTSLATQHNPAPITMATSTPAGKTQLEEPKLEEQQPMSQHVKNTQGSGTTKSGAHLPKGVSQTDEEKQKHWFIGSIDQGTTSSRFLIFNGEGNPVASHQIEFENMYPEPGFVLRSIYIAFIAVLTIISQMA